jgi:hypothetical protein
MREHSRSPAEKPASERVGVARRLRLKIPIRKYLGSKLSSHCFAATPSRLVPGIQGN